MLALLSGCGEQSSDTRPEDAGDDATLDSAPMPAQTDEVVVTTIDRGHLTDVGSAPLDYADPALWMCRPGNQPNACLEGLDATELRKDGSQRVEPHLPAPEPGFDCFYAYPTVDISGGGNTTDLAHIDLILDTLRTQAARFSRICEVYAPLYRQRSFNSMNVLTGDEELAYADVDSAFRYYLEHFNRGRNFVLIGHSQGAGALVRVATEHIDREGPLHKQLISALLIGGSLLAPEGQVVGGTFQSLPFCTQVAQTGCVVSFISFARDFAPDPDAGRGFGHAPEGSVTGCTNPALLAGNAGRYRGSYLPVVAANPLFVPDLPASALPALQTSTILVRDLFRGECVRRGSLNYLEISPDQSADDRRAVPPYRYQLLELLGIGMHIGDFSVVMDDLIDAVELQAAAMP